MKRKGRKKKFHPGVFFVLLTAMVVAVTAFMPWVMKPESLRKEKNAIHSILYGEFEQDFHTMQNRCYW